MGSRLYTKFAALIKRWPKETTTSEKQLGDYVKKTVLQAYSRGPLSVADEAKLEPFYESCNRLVSNVHKKKYERLYPNFTSSGIEKKIPENTQVNFDELLQSEVNEDSRTLIGKLKNTFSPKKDNTE